MPYTERMKNDLSNGRQFGVADLQAALAEVRGIEVELDAEIDASGTTHVTGLPAGFPPELLKSRGGRWDSPAKGHVGYVASFAEGGKTPCRYNSAIGATSFTFALYADLHLARAGYGARTVIVAQPVAPVVKDAFDVSAMEDVAA